VEPSRARSPGHNGKLRTTTPFPIKIDLNGLVPGRKS
jgi:hypothetical protein